MTGSTPDLPATTTGKKNTIQGAQAFHRAMTLVKLVANNNQKGMRLIDIAHISGLTIPTTHRLLQALVAEKLLDKIENSNFYAIGALVYELGFTAKRRFNVLQVCTPIVEVLAHKALASSLFCIKSDDDIVCMVKADSIPNPRKSAICAGTRSPLGLCASGVALLSTLSEETYQEIIKKNAPQYALYPNVDKAKVIQSCAQAQKNGYALGGDVYDVNTICVAVPVLNHQDECVASIAVLLPATDLQDAKYLSVLPNLMNAASDITLLMDGKTSLWEL